MFEYVTQRLISICLKFSGAQARRDKAFGTVPPLSYMMPLQKLNTIGGYFLYAATSRM